MPRRSASSLSIAPVTRLLPRLRAPRDLTPAQAAHWRAVVDALPADFFGAEQQQQLRAYATHAALAEALAARLAALDPEDDVAWVRLCAAQVSHSKAALAHARALRLTNQSRLQPDTAGNKARGHTGPATFELLQQRYSED